MIRIDKPSNEAIAEAKQNPGGWVYVIQGNFPKDAYVPGHAIMGAWKVNEEGEITGEFIANPHFKSLDKRV